MKASRNSRKASGRGDARRSVPGRASGSVREVDLHLRPGLAPAEALERQLARFRGELNSAIRAGETGVIFIHGVGTGKLREAIHTALKSGYPSCSWHDAPFVRYGYNGATVVPIRR